MMSHIILLLYMFFLKNIIQFLTKIVQIKCLLVYLIGLNNIEGYGGEQYLFSVPMH